MSMEEWAEDCHRFHGRLLTGTHAHRCDDWDGMPVDETTPEWESCVCPCACHAGEPKKTKRDTDPCRSLNCKGTRGNHPFRHPFKEAP